MDREEPEMGSYLVKLVRDRVDRLECPPERFGFDRLNHLNHVKYLRAKLVEEAVEFLQDPSVEELADVYEVVRALASVDLGMGPPNEAIGHISVEAHKKRHERGGFERGIGMFAEFEVKGKSG